MDGISDKAPSSMKLDLYRRVLAGTLATFVLSPRALWKLSGPDAMRYLNGQVTSDITRLADGAAAYAAVCTAKGRMEGDVTIARHGDDFFLDADAALRESLGARMDKFLIADDAVFEDISETWTLRHVFGAASPEAPKAGFVIARARFGVSGHDVWSSDSGASIPENSVDEDVVETLRLEHGIPRWGAELTTNTLPPEAGPHMLDAISYTKGCYVGQETIARLKSVGHVNRTLVFLKSDAADFPATGAKLTQDGREVGMVTSSGFSPRLERGMALAYVQRQHASDGMVLKAETLSLTIAPSLAAGVKS
jgi:folate-binding protein YgfZ